MIRTVPFRLWRNRLAASQASGPCPAGRSGLRPGAHWAAVLFIELQFDKEQSAPGGPDCSNRAVGLPTSLRQPWSFQGGYGIPKGGKGGQSNSPPFGLLFVPLHLLTAGAPLGHSGAGSSPAQQTKVRVPYASTSSGAARHLLPVAQSSSLALPCQILVSLPASIRSAPSGQVPTGHPLISSASRGRLRLQLTSLQHEHLIRQALRPATFPSREKLKPTSSPPQRHPASRCA